MHGYRLALIHAAGLLVLTLACLMGGCSAQRGTDPTRGPRSVGILRHEIPAPEGSWRPHELRRCADGDGTMLTQSDLDVIALANELYRLGEGDDAIFELEFHLARKTQVSGLVLLTLGQLYVLAAQGAPTVEPHEGPAAMAGDWDTDRPRLVARAEAVLREAAELRPDDSAVDYLLADAIRCRGAMATADQSFALGTTKCTRLSGMDVLIRFQEISPHPARQLAGVELEYPAAAARDGVSGEVVMDLLISPDGRVAQVTIVAEPDRRLGSAAATALLQATFSAGRIGKYPVWSWIRVTVAFG
jgi:TonB family protein